MDTGADHRDRGGGADRAGAAVVRRPARAASAVYETRRHEAREIRREAEVARAQADRTRAEADAQAAEARRQEALARERAASADEQHHEARERHIEAATKDPDADRTRLRRVRPRSGDAERRHDREQRHAGTGDDQSVEHYERTERAGRGARAPLRARPEDGDVVRDEEYEQPRATASGGGPGSAAGCKDARPAGRGRALTSGRLAADGPVPAAVVLQQQPGPPGLLRARRGGGVARAAHDTPRGEAELVEPAVGAAAADGARVVVRLARTRCERSWRRPHAGMRRTLKRCTRRAALVVCDQRQSGASCAGSSAAARGRSARRPSLRAAAHEVAAVPHAVAVQLAPPVPVARLQTRGSPAAPRAAGRRSAGSGRRCVSACVGASAHSTQRRRRRQRARARQQDHCLLLHDFPLSQPPQGALARRRSLPAAYLEDLLCPAGASVPPGLAASARSKKCTRNGAGLRLTRGHRSHRSGA